MREVDLKHGEERGVFVNTCQKGSGLATTSGTAAGRDQQAETHRQDMDTSGDGLVERVGASLGLVSGLW